MGRQSGTPGQRALSDQRRRDPVWASGPLTQVSWIDGRPVAWYVRLDGDDAHRDAGRAVLSAQEKAAFARTGDAPWRIMRRLLAKALIARAAMCHPDDVRIERDALGALRLVKPIGWHLSLAGQPPQALIGLHRLAIGVDIEPGNAPPPLEDAFSAEDLVVLAKLWPGNPDRARLIGWVAKEAHGKACGRARQLDPRDIWLNRRAGSLFATSHGTSTVVHIAVDIETIAAVAVEKPSSKSA